MEWARFSTGTSLPPKLMMPSTTIGVWIGLPSTAYDDFDSMPHVSLNPQ